VSGIHKVIRKQLGEIGFKARTVSISHLPEIVQSISSLIEKGFIEDQLSERLKPYLEQNDELPAAKTIIIVAMPEPITRIYFERQGRIHPADIAPNFFF
jgi:hypothetical protein